MLSIIYPYRNRDIHRLKISFDSLSGQSSKEFEVRFVDYGSRSELATEVKKLCENYNFIQYVYHPAGHQPWNKSKALNSVIKQLETSYCFVADVDIIFHPRFVERALELINPLKCTYFQLGFLDRDEKPDNRKFESFKKYRKSKEGATGPALFPVDKLKEIRGFDEFFHFWGAEDTDVLERLRNTGVSIDFFDREVLLLHQWHLSYRNSETNYLNNNLQIKGIVQINQEHLRQNRELGKKIVNSNLWGECLSFKDSVELAGAPVNLTLTNQIEKVEEFLYGQLPSIGNQIFKVKIIKDPNQDTLKHKLRKLMGRKVPKFHSFKTINDKILLQLISYYRDLPYHYKIEKDQQEIEVCVDFRKKGEMIP